MWVEGSAWGLKNSEVIANCLKDVQKRHWHDNMEEEEEEEEDMFL